MNEMFVRRVDEHLVSAPPKSAADFRTFVLCIIERQPTALVSAVGCVL
jgi:hypothetical protein